uniref:Death associated protein 1b n=1 Tax=Tetraodon nigroviridis TaxID=99883 RepID=H3C4Z0_TETNG
MGQLSSDGAAALLKAGHRPAVKAGGKRVAKKVLEEGVAHVTPEKDAKRSEKLSRTLGAPNRMQQVPVTSSHGNTRLSHDFPEIPVSVRHSKVRPAVEKSHSPRTFIIQQPRKF